MDEILGRVWQDLIARTQGPMWFRLILQPLVALVFGVRAGLQNARRAGDARSALLRQAWHDMSKVALIGLVLDVIVQWLVLGAVYPLEALLVVFLIVVVPYQIIRTVVAWIATK